MLEAGVKIDRLLAGLDPVRLGEEKGVEVDGPNRLQSLLERPLKVDRLIDHVDLVEDGAILRVRDQWSSQAKLSLDGFAGADGEFDATVFRSLLGSVIGHERAGVGMAEDDKPRRFEQRVFEQDVGHSRGPHGREVPVALEAQASDRDIVGVTVDGDVAGNLGELGGQHFEQIPERTADLCRAGREAPLFVDPQDDVEPVANHLDLAVGVGLANGLNQLFLNGLEPCLDTGIDVAGGERRALRSGALADLVDRDRLRASRRELLEHRAGAHRDDLRRDFPLHAEGLAEFAGETLEALGIDFGEGEQQDEERQQQRHQIGKGHHPAWYLGFLAAFA